MVATISSSVGAGRPNRTKDSRKVSTIPCIDISQGRTLLGGQAKLGSFTFFG